MTGGNPRVKERKRETWTSKAACRGMSHLFFPPAYERPVDRFVRVQTAQETCAACPVIEQCRDASVFESYGVWAGEDLE